MRDIIKGRLNRKFSSFLKGRSVIAFKEKV